MNASNAKDYLPLVQALAEGKVIQVMDFGDWIDLQYVTFERRASSYRIKPEPREIWVNEYADYPPIVHNSKEQAASEFNPFLCGKTVRYREVIE